MRGLFEGTQGGPAQAIFDSSLESSRNYLEPKWTREAEPASLRAGKRLNLAHWLGLFRKILRESVRISRFSCVLPAHLGQCKYRELRSVLGSELTENTVQIFFDCAFGQVQFVSNFFI